MVDNQRANQTAKPLKEGIKKNYWFRNSGISAVTPLASRPVCVS
jgi:hypothetical protein